MRSFIYHLKDKEGNLVDYVTGEKKLSDLIKKHEIVLGYLDKAGFSTQKARVPKQDVIEFDPNITKVCPTCGKVAKPRMGTSKSGKPYKGYFCEERGHDVIWAK